MKLAQVLFEELEDLVDEDSDTPYIWATLLTQDAQWLIEISP